MFYPPFKLNETGGLNVTKWRVTQVIPFVEWVSPLGSAGTGNDVSYYDVQLAYCRSKNLPGS